MKPNGRGRFRNRTAATPRLLDTVRSKATEAATEVTLLVPAFPTVFDPEALETRHTRRVDGAAVALSGERRRSATCAAAAAALAVVGSHGWPSRPAPS